MKCKKECLKKNKEVADRLHISYVRVKQIQDKAISKIYKKVLKENF